MAYCLASEANMLQSKDFTGKGFSMGSLSRSDFILVLVLVLVLVLEV